MTPNSALDKFRLHEIEQQLASELHAAREQTRLASTDEEKRNVLETYSFDILKSTKNSTRNPD